MSDQMHNSTISNFCAITQIYNLHVENVTLQQWITWLIWLHFLPVNSWKRHQRHLATWVFSTHVVPVSPDSSGLQPTIVNLDRRHLCRKLSKFVVNLDCCCNFRSKSLKNHHRPGPKSTKIVGWNFAQISGRWLCGKFQDRSTNRAKLQNRTKSVCTNLAVCQNPEIRGKIANFSRYRKCTSWAGFSFYRFFPQISTEDFSEIIIIC